MLKDGASRPSVLVVQWGQKRPKGERAGLVTGRSEFDPSTGRIELGGKSESAKGEHGGTK